MEINTFDLLLLFILAIATSLIIGINVLYVVDKKMSDIKINIPQCPIPELHVHTENGYIKKVNVEMKPMKSREIINQESFETFTDVMKSNDPTKIGNDDTNQIYVPAKTISHLVPPLITNSPSVTPLTINNHVMTGDNKERTFILRQGYESNGSDTPNTGDRITYPRAADIVRYSGRGCYQNVDTKHIRKIEIDEKKKYHVPCNNGVVKNANNEIRSGFMTAGGKIVNHDIRFFIPPLYMGEDPYIKGISYASMNIEGPADVDQIGSIPVNDYNGDFLPVGSTFE